MSAIPFMIPDQFLSGIASGTIVRIGTILKEVSSGQIVGHLQETGLGQHLLSGASLFSPFNTVNLASSIYTNVQISQMKSMLSSLAMMQFANCGVALIGIGVNIMVFNFLKKKIATLEQQIIDIKDQIDRHFDRMIEREIRTHYSRIQSSLDELETARGLSHPTAVLMSIASRLAEESGYFRNELNVILDEPGFNKEFFLNFLEAQSVCQAVRLECFLLSNEFDAAKISARQMGRQLSQISSSLEPTRLTKKILGCSISSGVTYRKQYQEMENWVKGLRDATEIAETKPFLIDTLIKNGINGRDYIDSLRNEKNYPLVVLKF